MNGEGHAGARDGGAQSPTLASALARHHLPALDGLRAIAVGGVMLFHFGVAWFSVAIAGVGLFFVLSGFLITHLLLQERAATGTISLGKFYLRRALRIFPAYYVFLAVSFAVMTANGAEVSTRLIATTLTYSTNYVQAFGLDRQTLVSHSWSLAIEEQFYLLWPLGLLLLLRGRRRPLMAIAVALVGIVAWRTRLFTTGRGDYIYYAFDTRADYLLVGCALALLSRREDFLQRINVVTRHAWFPLVTIALVGLSFRRPPFQGYIVTVGHTLVAMLLAVLLVQCMVLREHRGWRWLEWPAIRYLGRISYPLYLYHQLAPTLLRPLEEAGVRLAIRLPLEFAVSLALASLSWRVVERPFLALKRHAAVTPPQPSTVH